MNRAHFLIRTLLALSVVGVAALALLIYWERDRSIAPGITPISPNPVDQGQLPAAAPVEPLRAEDLESLQARVLAAVKKVQPAVVAMRHTRLPSAASGVIITPEGLVLSQWHVTHAVRVPGEKGESWRAGEKTVVVLADGREVRAELLGASVAHDLSLVRILEPGKYPFTPLVADAAVKHGDWIMKLGHPGHYRPGRPAMVRLGRVVASQPSGFVTDCLINGGDSGGPYFDLEGRLVGIVRGATADTSSIWPEDKNRFRDVNRFLFAGTSNSIIQSDLQSMLQGVVGSGGQKNFDNALKTSPRLPISDWMEGEATRAAFKGIASSQRDSVVEICAGDVGVGLATVATTNDDGALLVAKASELPPAFTCRARNGEKFSAAAIYVDQPHDLAVLKTTFKELRAALWALSAEPLQGELIVGLGMEELPLAVGVVSIPTLSDLDGAPTTAEFDDSTSARLSLLGHHENGVGYRIDHVFERTDFAAGLRPGDLVRSIDGEGIKSEADLNGTSFRRFDIARLELDRDGKLENARLAVIRRPVPGINARSTGFPKMLEVAAPLAACDCGAPILNLKGEAIGVLIARYDLQGCKVIPAAVVLEIVGKR